MTENQRRMRQNKNVTGCDFTVQNGNTQKDEAEKRDVSGGGPFAKGHRQSTISLESLYSLNSGQSSSSKHL